ncbi:hypothetical protein LX32DRAFT_431183 [Colletotrichum zoysiae]|uniref:Uncharacterized protein n=1 Tax=Colletotrichum zoysiae TaxID=1216348 RepID=A0AAD9HEP5_9PEZI|nr:hypothetical protein LX32DRAFT_431183 [Colletotrichum zoysiae]
MLAADTRSVWIERHIEPSAAVSASSGTRWARPQQGLVADHHHQSSSVRNETDDSYSDWNQPASTPRPCFLPAFASFQPVSTLGPYVHSVPLTLALALLSNLAPCTRHGQVSLSHPPTAHLMVVLTLLRFASATIGSLTPTSVRFEAPNMPVCLPWPLLTVLSCQIILPAQQPHPPGPSTKYQ